MDNIQVMEENKMIKIKLNSGYEMPQLGIGTFMASGNEQAKQSVLAALKVGYRLIDTAHVYNDERGVGDAIKESGVSREEIFLTSKLWPTEYGEGKTLTAIDKMLSRLGVEYIDLLLLHQPFGDAIGAWKEMEKAVEHGKVKSLGISNFEQYKFDEIIKAGKILPAVHQTECHPYRQMCGLRKKMKEYNMALMCWYPFGGRGEGGANIILNDEIIKSIAESHGKTPAQVVLRFEMQEGMVTIPGSFNQDHIAENFKAVEFELAETEMEAIRKLNKEQRFFVSFEGLSYEQAEGFALGAKLQD